MGEKVELIYFDIQGRALLPRVLLTMSGIEWTGFFQKLILMASVS